jgi:Resolvase, N terminal domain
MWMDIGYARVSTQDKHPTLQLDALYAAGCVKVFVEQASGAQRDRPQPQAALDYGRPGDTLVVWKLDRLARSLRQLIETIEVLAAREVRTTCGQGSSCMDTPFRCESGLRCVYPGGHRGTAGGGYSHSHSTWGVGSCACQEPVEWAIDHPSETESIRAPPHPPG